MKAKEIFKTPIYLITLFICICFAIAFFVSAFANDDDNDITAAEYGSPDMAYNAVLDKFAFDADEIDTFSILCEKADNEDYRTYQVSITLGEEVREFTVTAFSDGHIDALENVSGSENETGEGADSNKANGEASKPANENANDSKYADVELVKERVLMDSLLDEERVNFLPFTLDESGETPVYEVVFETKDGYRKYIYHVNALNGLLQDRTYYNADDLCDEENIFWCWENEEDDGARETYTYYNIWENLKTQAHRGSQSFYGEPVYPE